MKTSLIALAATLVATFSVPAMAQSRADQARWEQAERRFENERAIYESQRQRYEAARRRYGGGYNSGYNNGYGTAAGAGAYRDDYAQYRTDYDATQYYRDDPRYQERVLTANDEVYRGSDGRYYCRRSDGTTGLIIGGAGGALFGNMIDGGNNRVGGTLIGGALGALLGRSIEQNSQQVRCR